MQSYVTPQYVFREAAFVENYKRFESCFKKLYPNYRVSYSFKTNYTPYICKLVKDLGGYAEVVSMMEYTLAKKLGYPDDKIIFNGPSKEEFPDCILNVDNLDELREAPNKKLGIRVNIDVGQSFISRFGITDLDEAFRIAGDRIVGIHCHISQARSLEAWEKRTRIMLEIADKYFPEGKLEYIDLGSGMYGDMEEALHSQFSNVPSYEAYAAVTAGLVAEHFRGRHCPILFTEPGTTLINRYIEFVSKVISIKTIRGKTFVELNCSKHNLGEICELKKLPITVIPQGGAQQMLRDAELVGYTCLEHDVVYRGFTGELAVGDIVIFGNVGGYSLVSKPPFIRPNCPMVTETGIEIKRQETFDEVFQTYA
ncbi:MAG: hypothetical protein J6J12_05880 [Oscillospiraceae bacterium]|nr:hypothetical protein [Oscillospiraceae bacterium]